MTPSDIQTAEQLGRAVEAREIKTDANMYRDGGFNHASKTIENNPEVIGQQVEEFTYAFNSAAKQLTMTGRFCWSYAGVGNCYEMLNADGSLAGWYSAAHVKPIKPATKRKRTLNSLL